MAQIESKPAAGTGGDARALLLERLNSGHLVLPVIPTAATQVLQASRNENTATSKIAESLSSDPALAAHVLRAANSAAYAASEPIVSLSQAVIRIGLTTVSQIALAACMKAKLFQAGGYVDLVSPVWPRSAMAAIWAREIARVKDRDVEGAFLLGLLHDIGRPVVIQALLDLEKRNNVRYGEAQARVAMDYLHPMVGAALMRQWKMQDWMADAIAWHEDPMSAPQHREEALTASLAQRLAYWTLEGDANDASQLREDEVPPALGFDSEDLEKLLEQRDRVCSKAEALV
ncbi:MAG: HDOD domain-containing protein [Candidatus Eisenbacteria bacterium]|uniref:HDOD domain-containing protein n=1 Tax=Eiseniibacteriota bacterium TaxID=2212470 RepID=A0A849SN66_UNCEI|nr:HDOD domain-containing protein [Candidatus Eisenbacteria bacterium]